MYYSIKNAPNAAGIKYHVKIITCRDTFYKLKYILVF
jgi:uridine phosphorylase